MDYREMLQICIKYEMCSKCPYQIVNISENGEYNYKCKLRNRE